MEKTAYRGRIWRMMGKRTICTWDVGILLPRKSKSTYKQVIVLSRPRYSKHMQLVNALKLLANQPEDGDGLLQNIVTNLRKESRKGLTDGLREFIRIDSGRALDVGYLNREHGNL